MSENFVSQPAAGVSAYIKALEATPFFADANVRESFAYQLEYYRHHLAGPRWKFRIAGTTVIILSAGIPFLAAFGESLGLRPIAKDIAVAAMATAISVAAGFNTFFRWDVQWREKTTSKFHLQQLHASWELAKVNALNEADQAKAVRDLSAAAHVLVTQTYAVGLGQMTDFFHAISFPEVSKQS